MRLFSLLFLFLTICSCSKSKISAYTPGKVKIDSTLKHHLMFKWLDGENDYSMDGTGETPQKKTSIALYYSKWTDDLEIPPTYFYNNCRAYILEDTLVIRIGTTTYLSDHGINIKYKNGKYYGVPFQTYDIITEEESSGNAKQKDTFYLRSRRLYLDKKNYKIGDSVYGRVHLEVEEPERKTKWKKGIIEHIADGYFRAKIVKENEI